MKLMCLPEEGWELQGQKTNIKPLQSRASWKAILKREVQGSDFVMKGKEQHQGTKSKVEVLIRELLGVKGEESRTGF